MTSTVKNNINNLEKDFFFRWDFFYCPYIYIYHNAWICMRWGLLSQLSPFILKKKKVFWWYCNNRNIDNCYYTSRQINRCVWAVQEIKNIYIMLRPFTSIQKNGIWSIYTMFDNNVCIFIWGNILPCHFTVFLIATLYIIHFHTIQFIAWTSTMLGKIKREKKPSYTTAILFNKWNEIVIQKHKKCIFLAK